MVIHLCAQGTMDQNKILISLIQKVESFIEILNGSPYISHKEHLRIVKEIKDLSEQLHNGEISFLQGESTLSNLNKKAVADEISSLTTKISYLNPSSPRLENLRDLGTALHSNTITPEQARKRIQELMCA